MEYAATHHKKPVGRGDIVTHRNGTRLEVAIGKSLGDPIPDDWDWSLGADRARGYDVAGVHSRGSWNGTWFIWRPWDKKDRTWIFGCTRDAPRIVLTGYLTGRDCPSVAVARPGRDHFWIPATALHPLPQWLQARNETPAGNGRIQNQRVISNLLANHLFAGQVQREVFYPEDHS